MQEDRAVSRRLPQFLFRLFQQSVPVRQSVLHREGAQYILQFFPVQFHNVGRTAQMVYKRRRYGRLVAQGQVQGAAAYPLVPEFVFHRLFFQAKI